MVGCTTRCTERPRRSSSELTESTSDLNAALESLAGRQLDQVRLTALGPGEYGLALSADGFEIELRLGRNGARITTIGAG